MTARLLTGSKQEIAGKIASLQGEVREVIVFVEEPAANVATKTISGDDVFAEMQPYMTGFADIDDSREAIYTQQERE